MRIYFISRKLFSHLISLVVAKKQLYILLSVKYSVSNFLGKVEALRKSVSFDTATVINCKVSAYQNLLLILMTHYQPESSFKNCRYRSRNPNSYKKGRGRIAALNVKKRPVMNWKLFYLRKTFFSHLTPLPLFRNCRSGFGNSTSYKTRGKNCSVQSEAVPYKEL